MGIKVHSVLSVKYKYEIIINISLVFIVWAFLRWRNQEFSRLHQKSQKGTTLCLSYTLRLGATLKSCRSRNSRFWAAATVTLHFVPYVHCWGMWLPWISCFTHIKQVGPVCCSVVTFAGWVSTGFGDTLFLYTNCLSKPASQTNWKYLTLI